MPDVLTTDQVKKILETEPEAPLSLQRIRVEFKDGPGYLIAGYHIFKGHLPGMMHLLGPEIWRYIKEP